MKVNIIPGGYSFEIEEAELIHNMAASSIFEAKEVYMNFISSRIDKDISKKMNKLRSLEEIFEKQNNN